MLFAEPSELTRVLVPVPSGSTYRVASPPEHAMVTRELAAELRAVLERFGTEAGFTAARPVSVIFKLGVVGHHQVGRAADIYGVEGIGLDRWKARWDQAQHDAARAPTEPAADAIRAKEQRENLGWRLYKALQIHGRWSQPYGYPIQLFGPWTRSEGPWKYISDRLLRAHRDHVHIAK